MGRESTPDQRFVNVIIEFGHEILGPPRTEFSPGQPNPLQGDPTACGRSGVHGLVQETNGRFGITEAQSRKGKISADDSSLNGVS